VEAFYWTTIMFSQTLGTALGDWTADTAQQAIWVPGVIFSGLLALVALAYFVQKNFRPALFWTAFILTRPLGAVLGDFLDKPVAAGGLNLSRYAPRACSRHHAPLPSLVFRQRARPALTDRVVHADPSRPQD